MSFVFIPVYIKYLGIEAYGLVGFFAILQSLLTLLDMGLTPTLSREMARFSAGTRSSQSIRDLLRTIELITIVIALIVVSIVALVSNWVAIHWINTINLSVEAVTQALILMGGISALRFIENIYRSTIIGLQKQVLFNIINSIMATLRGVGAVVVLILFSPTIHTFFVWQAVISILSLGLLAAITYESLPKSERNPRFSKNSLIEIWRYAGGMLGITFLSLLLTQVDKILLTKLLTLSEYGYYALAATIAGALFMLIGPVIQTFYPRLCELNASEDSAELVETFHKGAQLTSVIAGSAAIVVIFFAEAFLRIWTNDHFLADRTAPLLIVLMLGNLLNGLMWIPYQAQLAHGWTSLTVKVNIFAVAMLVPAILIVTPYYGAIGAAWIWAGLNLGYVLIAVQFMYREILRNEKWRWYKQDVLAPLGAGAGMALLLKLSYSLLSDIFNELLLFGLVVLLVSASTLLAANMIRHQLLQTVQTNWTTWKITHGY